MQVLLTFGIFFTPVFYEPAMMGHTGSKFVLLNPLAALLEGLSLSVVSGHNLAHPLVTKTAAGDAVMAWSPMALVYSAVFALVLLVGSAIIFHRSESAFAENI